MKVDFEAKLPDIRRGQSLVSDCYLLENIIRLNRNIGVTHSTCFSSESTYLNSTGYNLSSRPSCSVAIVNPRVRFVKQR